MSRRRAEAAGWRTVAEVRALQSRAAELAAARAALERQQADEAAKEAWLALDDAQRGWAAALAGTFDPGLARRWFAQVESRNSEAKQAEQGLRAADQRLQDRRGEWHSARLQSDLAGDQRRAAWAEVSRAKDEARLAELEDRAARKAGVQ